MKQRTVLKMDVFPTRMPLIATVVLWLFLDRLHATGWVHGVCWTLMGCVWCAWIIALFTERSGHLPGFGNQD